MTLITFQHIYNHPLTTADPCPRRQRWCLTSVNVVGTHGESEQYVIEIGNVLEPI